MNEKYDEHPLEHYLDEYFENFTLNDLIWPCLIPAYYFTQRKAHVSVIQGILKEAEA